MKHDSMPPLPITSYVLATESDGYSADRLSNEPGFSDDQMHAYAKRYAEQCCAPLAKALDDLYCSRNQDTEEAAESAIEDYMKESQ